MSTLDGDNPCAECGSRENFVWFTDSTFWNNVVRRNEDGPYAHAEICWGGEPILCFPCFIAEVEGRGYRPTGWRILPEWPVRQDEPTP